MLRIEGEGTWKFDSNVVPVFDEHVRKSVPMYDEIHNSIKDISAWYIQENTNVYDVGTSTGEVIKNMINLDKDVNFIGVDTSREMIQKAIQEFNFANVRFLEGDVTERDFTFENASFIVSMLTIQFIQEHKRQELINKIYNGLNLGGAFIMVEKVIGSNARFNEIWIELYHQLKLKNGLNEQEVFAKSRAIRGVLKPYTTDENMSLLKSAGFKDIDMFFKWNNFAGFIAVK